MTDLEAMVRAFLHNAAGRHWAASRAEPETPSVDYRTGYADGREAGQVSALALVVSSITGESATALVEEAMVQAAVDSALPFDLHLEVMAGVDGEDVDDPRVDAAAGSGAWAPDLPELEQDLVPCPRCWLPADVLPPLPHDTNMRSWCPRGHESTLVPAVLEHLRSLMGPAFGQSA